MDLKTKNSKQAQAQASGAGGVKNNKMDRPLFKNSKWNDAEKWLISDHHLLHTKKSSNSNSNGNGFGIKLKPPTAAEEKIQRPVSIHHNSSSSSSSSSHVLKDKFTNPNFLKYECSEPLRESFLFKDPSMVMVDEVKSRDIGTEMTPLGTSRNPTPLKSLSPPRHNTPAATTITNRSNGGELEECHLLAKLKLETCVISNWSSSWSWEEEQEDISKSLTHFEINQFPKTISPSAAWQQQEEEKTKCCLRYQREEAKIQAWVDLQNAKAEAQSRKLEVKIQKMRSNFEEKVMEKMAIVHRKAEELRAAAQLQHTEQIQKATEQAKKTVNQQLLSNSCGCFPCNNLHSYSSF